MPVINNARNRMSINIYQKDVIREIDLLLDQISDTDYQVGSCLRIIVKQTMDELNKLNQGQCSTIRKRNFHPIAKKAMARIRILTNDNTIAKLSKLIGLLVIWLQEANIELPRQEQIVLNHTLKSLRTILAVTEAND